VLLVLRRGAVKGYIKRCVTCARHSARASHQLMGDIPVSQFIFPFRPRGGGLRRPFLVTPFVGRGQRARKTYVALFVCLATRAIHLELVEDCSAPAFLAALRRFVSRRGTPQHMYSDNATNFCGAELQLSFASLIKDSSLRDKLAMDGIDWHFISSAAPYFGGL